MMNMMLKEHVTKMSIQFIKILIGGYFVYNGRKSEEIKLKSKIYWIHTFVLITVQTKCSHCVIL